jgi:hypothetical protein
VVVLLSASFMIEVLLVSCDTVDWGPFPLMAMAMQWLKNSKLGLNCCPMCEDTKFSMRQSQTFLCGLDVRYVRDVVLSCM